MSRRAFGTTAAAGLAPNSSRTGTMIKNAAAKIFAPAGDLGFEASVVLSVNSFTWRDLSEPEQFAESWYFSSAADWPDRLEGAVSRMVGKYSSERRLPVSSSGWNLKSTRKACLDCGRSHRPQVGDFTGQA